MLCCLHVCIDVAGETLFSLSDDDDRNNGGDVSVVSTCIDYWCRVFNCLFHFIQEVTDSTEMDAGGPMVREG